MEHQGTTIWLTGLSGAGKSTIANLLARRLRAGGAKVEVLDGDVIRTNLSKGLGFSKEDRDTNIRRIGFVCGLLSRNGVIAIAAAISPYRNLRQEVRATNTNFVEVFTDCPLDTLVERDVKGLYKKGIGGGDQEFHRRVRRSIRGARQPGSADRFRRGDARGVSRQGLGILGQVRADPAVAEEPGLRGRQPPRNAQVAGCATLAGD